MEIVRACTAGFCMGVDLALRKLNAVLREDESGAPVFTLGPIIHNPQVLAEYEAMGVGRSEDPAALPEGSIVVIRAHGVPEPVRQALIARRISVVDATCPKVKKAQTLIEREAGQGKVLLLYGEENHPEVKGLLSYALRGAHVFDSLEELLRIDPPRGPHYFLAAQTTQDQEEFLKISQALREKYGPDMTVLSTICDATRRRQEEAVEIAKHVDYMVVVGGFDSGNTRRLAQVASAMGAPCIHVETSDQLPLAELRRRKKIGLTAGASTPKKIIDKVQSVLESL